MLVDFRGGASNRPGTMFVGYAWDFIPPNQLTNIRLVPFTFSTVQTYMLEFGESYIRFMKDGAYIVETSQAITGITKANPGVLTYVGADPTAGQWFYIDEVVGMSQINGQYVRAEGINTASNTMQLWTPRGELLDTSAYGTYTTAGAMSRVYTLTTPYFQQDIFDLKFTQSADTMTITHEDYAPRDLTRSGHTNWTLTQTVFTSSIATPTITVVVPAVGGGTTTYRYKVVGVSTASGESSLASPYLGTTTAIAMSSNITENIQVAFNTVSGADSYDVFRQYEVPGGDPGVTATFGYVGSSTGTPFIDRNIQPDLSNTPPIGDDPFAGGNYPKCSTYFQQRQVYGGSASDPQTFWMSQTGLRKNFDYAIPSQDDDAIEGTVASQQVNAIQFMLATSSGLLLMTTGSAFLVTGGGSPISQSAVTPSNVTATPQSFSGIHDNVEPLQVNFDILYVQAMGNSVRDLSFNLQNNVYTGTDLSILSDHLLAGYQIVQWCWAQEPNRMVWAVRSDGVLLGFTYIKEQDVYAWTHHITDGLYTSVASVQEGDESAVYFIVRRQVGGIWWPYVERLASRQFGSDVSQAWFLDCALANGGTDFTAIGTPNTTSGTIQISASGAAFSSSNLGGWIKINDGIVLVDTFTSVSQVSGSTILALANTYPASASEWSLFTTASVYNGLIHLEGRQVYALADGNVQGPFTVANTQVTLSSASHVTIIGEAYTSKLQTLYLDLGEPTVQGKRKKIAAVTARVKETRGIMIGHTFDETFPWQGVTGAGETPVVQGQLPELQTGDIRINQAPNWDLYGQTCIIQANPWPVSILGVVPEVIVGDT